MRTLHITALLILIPVGCGTPEPTPNSTCEGHCSTLSEACCTERADCIEEQGTPTGDCRRHRFAYCIDGRGGCGQQVTYVEDPDGVCWDVGRICDLPEGWVYLDSGPAAKCRAELLDTPYCE